MIRFSIVFLVLSLALGLTADPLHDAAENGQLAEVQRLIRSGSNVNAQRVNGLTPLHLAASFNHLQTAAALLSAGANPAIAQKHGRTPLHLAAYNGHVAMLRLLLSHGAPINAADSSTKATALHLAAMRGQLAAVQFLVASGAAVNPKNSIGMSPLDSARETDQTAVEAWLRQNGGRQYLQ